MTQALNPEMVLQVEKLSSHFMNFFKDQLEQCSNDFEYYNLCIASLVFKNMVTYQFEALLQEDGGTDTKEILTKLHEAALEITKNVIARTSKNSQMLN